MKVFQSIKFQTIVSLIALCALLSFPAHGATPFELKIIQPAAGLDTSNRYYRAYPGIEFNVQISAVGGEFPYTYSLVNGPAGMSVAGNSGVLTWTPSPRATPVEVTVSVEDNRGRVELVTWPIAVTTDKFLFVDSTDGRSDASGTIDNPLRSVADIYGGTEYAAKRAGTYQDHFVYFREGTYKLDGYRVDARVQWTNSQPVVMMAFPGETPILDLSETYLWGDSGLSNFYLEGFNVNEIATKHPSNPSSIAADHKAFRLTGNSSNVTFRRNLFHNLAASANESVNQSVIMATAAEPGGENWAVIDNEFKNIHRAYGIIGYDIAYVLVQNNVFDNYTLNSHAIGPKANCEHWYIRSNTLTNIQGDAIWLYWADNGGVDPYGNIEVSYNYAEASTALIVNQRQTSMDLPLYAFRNTLIGDVEFRGVDSSATNHFVHNNIIVNDYTASNGVSDGIRCANNCTATAKINGDEDNIFYRTSQRSQIVDSMGRIIPSKRAMSERILGFYGWEMVNFNSPRQTSARICHTNPSGQEVCVGN